MVRCISYMPLVVALVHGCSNGSSGVTFEDYTNQLVSMAGPSAINCGDTMVSSLLEINTCLVNPISNKNPFYAIYRGFGDSQTATALLSNETGVVFIVSFDSDPTGAGRLDNGVISSDECVNPTFSPPSNSIGMVTYFAYLHCD